MKMYTRPLGISAAEGPLDKGLKPLVGKRTPWVIAAAGKVVTVLILLTATGTWGQEEEEEEEATGSLLEELRQEEATSSSLTAELERLTAAEMDEVDLIRKLERENRYDQLEAMSKMGPLKKLMDLIPGMGMSVPEEQMRVGEEKLNKFKVIMRSMTPAEMEEPKLLNASRIRRVAKGSGTTEADVRELLKQYEFMKKFMKSLARGRGLKSGPLAKMMKEMSKGGQPGPGGVGKRS